ncbi:MAG TPA: D-alanine--D-alanine ligase [Chthoniobacterales bacterium]|jgi:D-alanine-D-alanine ligase
MSLHIAVLLGGPGAERDVSLRSGSAVATALRAAGHTVTEVDVRNADFAIPAGVDIAFNVIHGTYGEDGDLQAELEKRGIVYSGDAPEANRLAFDKILSKQAFTAAGISTPQSETLRSGARPTLSLPLVVKAPRQGSSVGVYICKTQAELDAALTSVTEYGEDILVEEFIQGDELTVGILGDLALPIILICPQDGVYDFKNKYPWLNPGGAAEHFCPAPFDEMLTKRIQELALAAHRSLGLQVYSRVDVLLSSTGEPFVLEVNTVPGMTESSLLPEAAGVAGFSMAQLCERIIELSKARLKGATP